MSDEPIGSFLVDYEHLNNIDIGYARVISCHECAIEYASHHGFNSMRGWCYVAPQADLLRQNKLLMCVFKNDVCTKTLDELVDEISEYMLMNGQVLQRNPENPTDQVWLRIDVDLPIEKREWKKIFDDTPDGCVDISDEENDEENAENNSLASNT